MEFTKEDLLSLKKRIDDINQELTDYSSECGEIEVQEELDNSIGCLSDAAFYLVRAQEKMSN